MFEELLRRLSMGLSDFTALMQRLNTTPVVRSNLVSATVPAGELSVTVYHGLGRAHSGAAVVASSEPVTATCLPASNATQVTLELSATQLVDVTLKLLVF